MKVYISAYYIGAAVFCISNESIVIIFKRNGMQNECSKKIRIFLKIKKKRFFYQCAIHVQIGSGGENGEIFWPKNVTEKCQRKNVIKSDFSKNVCESYKNVICLGGYNIKIVLFFSIIVRGKIVGVHFFSLA